MYSRAFTSRHLQISAIVLCDNDMLENLPACLLSLANQTRPPDEILVITLNAVAEFAARISHVSLRIPLRHLESPAPNFCAARLLAVQEAQGDWAAFTLGDCKPFPDWIGRIEAAACEGGEAVGGPVESTGEIPQPWWWHPGMTTLVGLQPTEDATKKSSTVPYALLSNWAAVRALLQKEPLLETAAQEGEDVRADSRLWRLLRHQGRRVVFNCDIRVQRSISPNRLKFIALLRNAWADGRAHQRYQPEWTFLQSAMDEFLAFPFHFVLGIWSGPVSPWREATWHIVCLWRQIAQWRECIHQKGFWLGALAFFYAFVIRLVFATSVCAIRLLRKIGIFLLRVIRPRRSPTPTERRILIAASGYLGETVLLHPLLTGLRSSRPDAHIALLTNKFGEAVFRHDPAINQLLLLSRDNKTVKNLIRNFRPDLILVPYFRKYSPAPLYSVRRARVVTFGRNTGFSSQWWCDRADKRLPKPEGQHETVHLGRLFTEAGFKGRITESPLGFLPEEMEAVDDTLKSRGLDAGNFVLLAPGTHSENKRWLVDRWAKIVRHLVREYHLIPVFTGAAAEEEYCRAIAALSGVQCDIECQLSIREMTLWISHARLLVCADNGPKHLAVFMDTPSLTLFGPSDERQWGALHNPRRHCVVRGCTWDLTPEERVGLPPDHQMQCISTEQVIRALDEMLGEE